MDIQINDRKHISTIQEEFNSVFPYLKIEFFKHEHEKGEGSPLGDMIPSDSLIGKWRTVHDQGDIHIEPSSTVAEVEKSFQDKFGISAQVFRRSGEIWLETTVTDSWTLKEQNSTGEEMSLPT